MLQEEVPEFVRGGLEDSTWSSYDHIEASVETIAWLTSYSAAFPPNAQKAAERASALRRRIEAMAAEGDAHAALALQLLAGA